MKRTCSRWWLALAAVAALLAVAALACAPAAAPTPEPKAEKPAAAAPAAAKPGTWTIIPNAPPRPTPAPPPPGATPAPPPKPPAPKVVPLYAYVDTVTAGAGESKYNVDASLSCVKTSTFARGMFIVWRMEVVDTSNGKVLQGDDVADATLKLAHGEEVKFRYGRHGATEDSPWFWTAGWAVPPDYPLGLLDFSIAIAAKSGKSLLWRDPMPVSMAERNVESRLRIVATQ